MSFSADIKHEIAPEMPVREACCLAELSALYLFCGHMEKNQSGMPELVFQTENEAVARKCFTLLNKTYNIGTVISEKRLEYRNRLHSYSVRAEAGSRVQELMRRFGMDGSAGEDPEAKLFREEIVPDPECIRAFLRGCFLAAGSVTDPTKTYHMEIVCPTEERALHLQELTRTFGASAHIIQRKKNWILYLKDGEQIAEMLSVVGAHQAMMKLENVRIKKGVNNYVNRQVNCDAANIQKAVSAAQDHIKDIEYIQNTAGLASLPENLRLAAEARLEHPDVNLKELGALLDPPVGKSGINHRLKKLKEIADKLRETRGGL